MDLQEFFAQHPKVALGFSGGVDSSYLLYAGIKYGADIKPYFVKGPFQPEFERQDVLKMAELLHIDNLAIVEANPLADGRVVQNDQLRCYYCKQNVFGLIKELAARDGYKVLIDGTNASDDLADRPGFKALQEMQVLSPLLQAGLTKSEIRRRSQAAGLFTWDKPSYACLATRIPTGCPLELPTLQKVERAEAALLAMGYSDFRIRVLGKAAKLQLKPQQMEKRLQEREKVKNLRLREWEDIYLDLKER